MQFQVGFATDIGLRRSQNQDSGASCPELGLFLVADGMGGHRGGEIASAMTAQIIPEMIQKSREESKPWNPKQALNEAIQEANHAIFERAIHEPELQGMGTTTTALLFHEGRITVGHVGDSRAYFFRPGCVWQLTRDHSLVQEKLRAGLITREQAKNDQMRNVITRSVGFGHETVVELYEMQYQPGDVFLLCSDGLSGQVEDKEILEVIESRMFKSQDPKGAVDDLISWANARGGYDNTTVIAVQVK
jgi:serine/threonine protein phosphatase PrpC